MVGYAEANTCKYLPVADTCRGTKPLWLEVLLAEKFFASCTKHDSSKKNEKNIFCLDCISSICQHCVSDHKLHHLLQIRRYVYHDVIRLHDIQKLLDCSRVQTYTINSARVVFLKERPQPKSSKGLGSNCESCERSLQDAYKFCSVACKVDMSYTIRQGIQGQEMEPIGCDTSTSTHDTSTSTHLPCIDDENMISEGQLDFELTASTTSSESTQTNCSSPLSRRNFISKRTSFNNLHHKACIVSRTPRRPRYHRCDPSSLKLSSILKPIIGPCSASLHSVIIPSPFSRRKCSKPHRSPLSWL